MKKEYKEYEKITFGKVFQMICLALVVFILMILCGLAAKAQYDKYKKQKEEQKQKELDDLVINKLHLSNPPRTSSFSHVQ